MGGGFGIADVCFFMTSMLRRFTYEPVAMLSDIWAYIIYILSSIRPRSRSLQSFVPGCIT